MREQTEEMKNRVCSSHSYEEALCIIGEYVNITSGAEELLDGPGGAGNRTQGTGHVKMTKTGRKGEDNGGN